MPHWHSRVDGQTLRLSHIQPDETGDVWAGEVLLWRGAPSWESHPELLAAASRVSDPAVNRDLIRHAWTWDLPETWEGFWNCGDDRRYMTLSASGGSMNWRLVLRFPRYTPPHVFAAVAAGFAAVLQGIPAPRPAAMLPTVDCNAAEPDPAAVETQPHRRKVAPARGKSRARTIAANRQEATP